MKRLLPVAALTLAAACASEETKTSETPATDFTWEGGDFIVTANAVTDGCLDGAADAVALPGGAGSTREFGNPLPFPGKAGLPGKVTVSFVSPFSAVETTVTSPEAFKLEWDPKPVNKDVDLGVLNSAWTGCLADFEFGGHWSAVKTADGDVKFEGTAEFIVTKTNENAACPVFDNPTPCSVALDVIATRKK